MVPVAQEYAGLTAFGLGLLYEPSYEVFTVVVVYPRVALQPKVYVRETGDFFKECHVLPLLLYSWFVIGHVHFVLELDVLEVILEI